MCILPFEKFCLQSTLSHSEVTRIFTGIHEEKQLDFSAKHLEVTNEPDKSIEFVIEPIVKYRSSFLPLITGTAQSNLEGSRIVVTMSLPTVTYAFLLGLVVWAFISLVLLFNDDERIQFSGSLYISKIFPIAVAFPVVIIAIVAFKLEVHRNRRSIIKRLAAAEMV